MKLIVTALAVFLLGTGEASACPAFCKVWNVISFGSHFIPAPTLFAIGPFAVTPVGIAVGAVSAVCFLEKHPSKPVTKAQLSEWDQTIKASGFH